MCSQCPALHVSPYLCKLDACEYMTRWYIPIVVISDWGTGGSRGPIWCSVALVPSHCACMSDTDEHMHAA